MKVIFLDIDGVINDHKYRESVDDYYENPIDESKLELLRYIVDTTDNAVIVLTSTWRMYWNEGKIQLQEEGEKLNEIFKKHGLKIYAKTENFGEDRDYEILMWLAKNKVDSYVILDDMDFGWSPENRKRFVKTDDATGLDERTTEKAIGVLMNECYADITTVDDNWLERTKLYTIGGF
ncbi:MAG: hypothetical protein IJ491_09675 [Clostridia bacterium]|nr:hypothetical protein [Clostridia bacterium]